MVEDNDGLLVRTFKRAVSGAKNVNKNPSRDAPWMSRAPGAAPYIPPARLSADMVSPSTFFRPPPAAPTRATPARPTPPRGGVEERRVGNRPGTPSATTLSWDYLPEHAINRNVATELARYPSGGNEMADLYSSLGLTGAGGGGGGGGGRLSNPDPMGWNAIAREQALKDAYAGMGGALDAQTQAQLDAITGREGRITQAGTDARRRMDETIANLNTLAGQTGEQVGQAYGQAGANIDQLLSQYAGQQQALGQGAARTLGAFGVGPEELGVLGPSVAETMGVYRGGLAGLGGIAQADLASRPLTYGALGADTIAALTANEQRALAEAADERARIQADAARQRAELAYRQLPELFGIQDAEIARRERYA